MSKIILQPCANLIAQSNFRNTIENSVSLRKVLPFVTPEEAKELRKFYPSGKLQVWGVQPRNGLNEKKWTRITRGDIALFSKNKTIFTTGIVTLTLHNKALAEALWGNSDIGDTWEYIYFLTDIKTTDIAVRRINKAARYNAVDKQIQGFNVLDEEKSQRVLKALKMPAGAPVNEVSKKRFLEVERRLSKLTGTNVKVLVDMRVEQQYLKQLLFRDKHIGTCGICNKVYPVSLLRASHIKKRSKCILKERINRNIVMPMCIMGCDGLYEEGYISVRKGKVVNMKKTPVTEAVNSLLSSLTGNKCSFYNESTKAFFDWHYKEHFKSPSPPQEPKK
ncbi:HNH endonuclease [Chitinophaga sp. SYP-B3965]|uniref:HNH endonuclease n=1 Tax=Chitinophaga sp. SYP-B3965 TaxID=2663120 RepID=UPI001299A801|nr:HNH endonuclease [Chitinophaga sp. SYP-B3965]MRG48582.1 HNH endonuclease [Chitinophaga sp. SYP-B3965]